MCTDNRGVKGKHFLESHTLSKTAGEPGASSPMIVEHNTANTPEVGTVAAS